MTLRPRMVVFCLLAFLAGIVVAWYLARPGVPAAAPALPRVGADFTLLDARGQAVRWSAISQRLQLVFFGFTHCPEACPTTLANASRALEDLGASAADVGLVLISVDPGRDTPEAMGAYVARFGPRVTGYTGSASDIAAAAAAFHVYYETLPPMEDGSYMVNHAATLFLVGAGDEILEILPYGVGSADIAAAVGRHL
ncbi:MAG: SCO family protein [Gammaproteobacteria bacterium]|nr:SCO family protein [Gammaproteobacteria bacterium]